MLYWAGHHEGRRFSFGHAAVAVEHKVFSFGGNWYCETDMDQIDVNVFNTVSLRWVKFPPVTPGRGERYLEVPSSRRDHTAVLIEDIVYIWGGLTCRGWSHCNVLYAFDVHTNRWVKPEVSGTVPEGRLGHSACVLGKVMFIHGGETKIHWYPNDMYKLDTTTMLWALINTRGTPPSLIRHSATIIGTKMFVFGRGGVQGNIIRVFDTETNCWLNTPSGQLLPETCNDHSAFAYNGELYIFGGSNRGRTFNVLCKYSPDTFSWKKVEPKGKDPCSMFWPRCCIVGDRIIAFDDDLYILDFSPSMKTLCKLAVIQYGLEQSELPHDVRWELAAMTTKNRKKKEKKTTK